MDSEARRASVLIVDDQRVVLRMFARTLQSIGYEARVADNAEDALASVRMDPPDAILLDLTMPFVNGIGLLYRLRAAAPQIPVAIVTGTAVSKEMQDELDELGAVVYLKPLTPEQIEHAVQTLLGLTPDSSRRSPGPSCIFCGHDDVHAVMPDARDIGARFECANCLRRFVVKSPQPW